MSVGGDGPLVAISRGGSPAGRGRSAGDAECRSNRERLKHLGVLNRRARFRFRGEGSILSPELRGSRRGNTARSPRS
jgi:hypothetical protein